MVESLSKALLFNQDFCMASCCSIPKWFFIKAIAINHLGIRYFWVICISNGLKENVSQLSFTLLVGAFQRLAKFAKYFVKFMASEV